MEYDQTVRGEIRQALTYPAVLVCAGLGAVVMMFTFVVPKFATLLKRADDLPWLAAAVLNTGMFLRQWFPAVLLLVAALVAWLIVAAQSRYPCALVRRRWNGCRCWGPGGSRPETATWARVLSTLLTNRVPLMDALGLARASADRPVAGRAWTRCRATCAMASRWPMPWKSSRR